MKVSDPVTFRFGVYVIWPLARNATEPLVPCVTAVIARAAFSKVSIVAPDVPVMALKTTAVSSCVAIVSLVMSATAVILMPTVVTLADCAPFDARTPESLPSSLTLMVSVSTPAVPGHVLL